MNRQYPVNVTTTKCASALLLGWMLLMPIFTFAATSITQHGITWTFDKDYVSGQFANGDYWIVGPANIVKISPASTLDSTGRTANGSMVNPTPGLGVAQGFDSSALYGNFKAELNAARPKGLELSIDNPLSLPINTSVVSSISNSTPATRPQLTDAAVLTILGSAPPANSFRPPYVGIDKTIVATEADLNYTKLKNLSPTASAPSIQNIENNFIRPWIEIDTEFSGRELHPSNNEPNYGREISNTLAEGLMCLNLNYTNAQKRNLLVRMVQYGIDVYGAAKNGGIWKNAGGHNQGRKMPLLLAGVVLNKPEILAWGDGTAHRIFQEDQQSFYVSQADVDMTHSTAWDPDTRGGVPVPYEVTDIGMPEWGINGYTRPANNNKLWTATYRDTASSSSLGHVLVAHIMGLEALWNWPATFDYYDRYWKIEAVNAGAGTNQPSLFCGEMWTAYRTPKSATPPSGVNVDIIIK